MGRFLGKLLITFVVIVLVISTTALGVLFIVRTNDYNNAQNEITKVKADLKTAQDKVAELQALVKDPNAKIKFGDSGLGIKGEYPASWTVASNTKVETESTTTTTTLKNVELKFSKGESTVTLSRLFGPVGDLAVGYPSSTYDVKVLNDKVIRVANKGTNEWSYKSNIKCSEAVDVPTGTDVCGSGSFFPGFGTATGSAGFASAVIKDTALLDEADGIVLSTLN